ncbi:unnamed protein product [Rotaria socialis]
MKTLKPFMVNQTSTTTLDAESRQLNQHDISDRQDSYTSFYSCHTGSELAQENTILRKGDEIKSSESESSSNKNGCIINGDRREMNAKNSNHHPRHVVVDSSL